VAHVEQVYASFLVATLDGWEKAIGGLVEPGGFADLVVAIKGFADGAAEFFKDFSTPF